MKSFLILFGIAFGSIRKSIEDHDGLEPGHNELFNEDFDLWCQQWGYSFNQGSLRLPIMVRSLRAK